MWSLRSETDGTGVSAVCWVSTSDIHSPPLLPRITSHADHRCHIFCRIDRNEAETWLLFEARYQFLLNTHFLQDQTERWRFGNVDLTRKRQFSVVQLLAE